MLQIFLGAKSFSACLHRRVQSAYPRSVFCWLMDSPNTGSLSASPEARSGLSCPVLFSHPGMGVFKPLIEINVYILLDKIIRIPGEYFVHDRLADHRSRSSRLTVTLLACPDIPIPTSLTALRFNHSPGIHNTNNCLQSRSHRGPPHNRNIDRTHTEAHNYSRRTDNSLFRSFLPSPQLLFVAFALRNPYVVNSIIESWFAWL